MTWYLIVHKETGALLSEGSRLPEYDPSDIKKRDQPLPAHAEVITLEERPDWRSKKWDSESRALVDFDRRKAPRNALELLKRMELSDFEAVLLHLGVAQERIDELKMEK